MQQNGSRDTRSASWGRRALWACGAVVLGLLLLELGLRGFGAFILERQIAGSDDRTDAGRTFTILCAGDSWTQGAPYGRYPDFLVQRLNARYPRVHFRAINTGLAGTNSSQGLRRLAQDLTQERPDLIVAMTGNNDHHNLTDSTYWKFEQAELRSWNIAMAGLRTSLHGSRVYRLSKALWQRTGGGATSNEFFEAGSEEHHRGLIAIDRTTHRKQLEYNLTKIVETARNHEIPIVFQTYFHFHGYRVNEVIRDVAVRHAVPLADHNLWFHTEVPPGRRQRLRIEDGHPSREGYARIARKLEVTLDETGLLP